MTTTTAARAPRRRCPRSRLLARLSRPALSSSPRQLPRASSASVAGGGGGFSLPRRRGPPAPSPTRLPYGSPSPAVRKGWPLLSFPRCACFFLYIYLFSSCLMLGAAAFLMQVILCVWQRARRRHILTMNTGNSPSLISLRSHILTMDLHTLNISLRSQNIAYPVKQISEVVFSSWIIDILCFHAKSN